MNVEVSREEFSPLYNSEAESLKIFLLSDANSKEEKLKAIEIFSKKFTVIPSLLKIFDPQVRRRSYCIAVSNLVDDSWAEFVKIHNLYNKSLNQFSSPIYFEPFTVRECLWVIEKQCTFFLQFPHSALKKYYDCYHRFSSSPMPKEIEEKYRKSLILYKKIKAAESDNEEWLELVMETCDITFIIQNIECRIGSRPHEKEMWKLYIKFLRNFDLLDLMYHTYSRYCSLFTDDLEMREEFKKEIENDMITSQKIVSKWKLDVVKIEKNFGILENALSLFNKYFSFFKNETSKDNFEVEFQQIWRERKNKNPCSFLHGILNKEMIFYITRRTSKKCIFKNDAIHQTFALPSTAMNFMIKNAKFEHLQKLYGTCKYFYGKLKSPLCSKIMIGLSPKCAVTFKQNLFVASKKTNAAYKTIKKCHVKDGIHINKTPPTLISSFIQNKIYKCEISRLSLYHQEICMEDFLKIVSNVKFFHISYSYIFDHKNQNISIPEIIAKMPSIKELEIQNLYDYCPFPPTSKVPKMEKKLERFEGRLTSSTNDPAKICEFLKASITSNAIVDIHHYCSADEAERAKACILAMFESWKRDESFKPNIQIDVKAMNTLMGSFRWPLETPIP